MATAIADEERLGATSQPGKLRRTGVPILIILLGVGILLYPIISTVVNNRSQREAAAEYAALVEEQDPTALREQLESAREYNQTRTVGPILDPWTARLADDNESYKAYLQELSLSSVMARITIPAINVDLPIYHGTRPDTLDRGIGHLFGTDLPVGGKNSHAVLTGHTGLQNATMFDNLVDLKVGDSIYIDVYGEKLRYDVFDTDVVLPDDVDTLNKVADRDLLTLITCTPYGVNSHRLLVYAERAPLEADDVAVMESGGANIPMWMWLFGAMAALALMILAWLLFRKPAERKSEQDVKENRSRMSRLTVSGKNESGDYD